MAAQAVAAGLVAVVHSVESLRAAHVSHQHSQDLLPAHVAAKAATVVMAAAVAVAVADLRLGCGLREQQTCQSTRCARATLLRRAAVVEPASVAVVVRQVQTARPEPPQTFSNADISGRGSGPFPQSGRATFEPPNPITARGAPTPLAVLPALQCKV